MNIQRFTNQHFSLEERNAYVPKQVSFYICQNFQNPFKEFTFIWIESFQTLQHTE